MKKVIFLFAKGNTVDKDIYFVCNSEGTPIGKQFKATFFGSVKLQFEDKGYKVETK